jgi:hypothetical protein
MGNALFDLNRPTKTGRDGEDRGRMFVMGILLLMLTAGYHEAKDDDSSTPSVEFSPSCFDGFDNEGDGMTDADDPDCDPNNPDANGDESFFDGGGGGEGEEPDEGEGEEPNPDDGDNEEEPNPDEGEGDPCDSSSPNYNEDECYAIGGEPY